ncbi:hypothetical protein [Pelotomaculum terephthalicicum]|nr:hypothetical protein [Pelotomaculum terephthalicicum]
MNKIEIIAELDCLIEEGEQILKIKWSPAKEMFRRNEIWVLKMFC